MAKSPEEEREEQVKELRISLEERYNRQKEIAKELADEKLVQEFAEKTLQKLGNQRANLEKDLIDLDGGDKKKSLEEQIEGAEEELRQIRVKAEQLDKESVTLKKYEKSGKEQFKDLTGMDYERASDKAEQSHKEAEPTHSEPQAELGDKAASDKKSLPSEITDTTAIQVFIPLDKEKESFVTRELLNRIDSGDLEGAASVKHIKGLLKDLKEEDKAEIHDIVNRALKEALEKGSMQKIEPSMSQGDPTSCSYEHEGGKLNQKERSDGKFEFAPTEGFSGILRVERQGPDGKLLKDSADIVEYKDGKPIAVIPAKEGETRIANFGKIAREAGIEVTASKAIADEGIKVSALDPDKFLSKHQPTKPTREAPKPPMSPSHHQDKGGHSRG